MSKAQKSTNAVHTLQNSLAYGIIEVVGLVFKPKNATGFDLICKRCEQVLKQYQNFSELINSSNEIRLLLKFPKTIYGDADIENMVRSLEEEFSGLLEVANCEYGFLICHI